MSLIPVEVEKAGKESDLKVNGVYPIVQGANNRVVDVRVYEGVIKGKHSFMHQFGKQTILSWRNYGSLEFTDKGIKLNRARFEIYELGSRKYRENIKIINEKRRR